MLSILRLLAFSCLILVTITLFNETALYQFKAISQFYANQQVKIIFSKNDKALSIMFRALNGTRLYKMLDFNGDQLCYNPLSEYQTLMEWPSGLGLLFQTQLRNQSSVKYLYQAYQYNCTRLKDLLVLSTFYRTSFTYQNQKFYMATINEAELQQYDLKQGKKIKSYSLQGFKQIYDIYNIYYSQNYKYLYLEQYRSSLGINYMVFDCKSGKIVQDIRVQAWFIQAFADGEGFLGSLQYFYRTTNNNTFYNVRKDGQSRQILKLQESNKTFMLGLCTRDNMIIAIRQQSVKSLKLIVYSSGDGSIKQQFPINSDIWIPNYKYNFIYKCQGQYLAFLTNSGLIQIYQYKYAQQENFPVWAYILIAVGSLFLIGGVVLGLLKWRNLKMRAKKETSLLQEQNKQSEQEQDENNNNQ